MKSSKTITYLVYSIIGLAVVGLIITLIDNPIGLFKNILTIVFIAAIFFLLIRVITGNRIPIRSDQRAFMKAARLSKKRLKKHVKPKRTMNKHKRAIKRSSIGASHLTVIEGKKGKKRNRAMH